MLLDHRVYTIYPQYTTEFLKLVEEEILPIQAEYCGNLIFYSTVANGPLNRIVQVWAYQDAADRDSRRGRLWQDKRWKDLAVRALPMIQNQENWLLAPTSFSPTQWV
jgi:hypothetical protein